MIREYIVEITDEVKPDAFERFENEYAPEQELVRCKNCIHHRKDTCAAGAGIAVPPPDDWFCADGKRKD